MKKLTKVLCALLASATIASCGSSPKAFFDQQVNETVTVTTYVQASQGWWSDKQTLYTQNDDGGIFIYNMPISQEESKKLVPGTCIKVTGTKTEYKGELEIADVTSYEIVAGKTKVYPATDVTSKLGTEELINYQNQFVSFKGGKVVASTYTDKDGASKEAPFLYNWDGSGSAGSNNDLYFKVEFASKAYQFTVESYLCGETTDVYKKVTTLKVGDTVDMEGFLYWYDGANPHITSVVTK